MRSLCRYLFCGLALLSFAIFVAQQLSEHPPSENALQFAAYTAGVTVFLLGLIWLAKQIWQARDLIGRIIIGLVIVMIIILVATVPELQAIGAKAVEVLLQQPLVITVLSMILCGFCRSRSTSQSKT